MQTPSRRCWTRRATTSGVLRTCRCHDCCVPCMQSCSQLYLKLAESERGIVLILKPVAVLWCREALGTEPRASTSGAECAGVTILQEKQEVRGAEGAVCCFTVTLARSMVTFDDSSLLQASMPPPPQPVCCDKRSCLCVDCDTALLFVSQPQHHPRRCSTFN